MAKLTPGIGYSGASGSVAAVTYEHSGRHWAMRGKVFQRSKAPTSIRPQRGRMAAVAGSWRSLTNSQRLAWDSWASVRPPQPGKFGPHQAGGFQSFVEINMQLLEVGLPTVTDPPALAQPTIPVIQFGTVSIAGSQMMVGVVNTGPAGTRKVLYASAPLFPGRSNFNGLPLRMVAIVTGISVANRFSAWTALYGGLSSTQAGNQILWRAITVTPTGIASQPTESLMNLLA